jgi:hypothetical protein
MLLQGKKDRAMRPLPGARVLRSGEANPCTRREHSDFGGKRDHFAKSAQKTRRFADIDSWKIQIVR